MVLNIKWQRLVVEGETCKRCGLTEKEVRKAVDKLKGSLEPLKVGVKFKEEELSKKEFQENPKQSNMIFINERPLESWLGAETGGSECCDVCGDEECRTVEVNEKEYEVVPSGLIVKAGLRAVSNIKENKCSCDSKDTSKCHC